VRGHAGVRTRAFFFGAELQEVRPAQAGCSGAYKKKKLNLLFGF
jgi:hypothetical protein